MTLTRFMLVIGCCSMVSCLAMDAAAQGQWQQPHLSTSAPQQPVWKSNTTYTHPVPAPPVESDANPSLPAAPYELTGRYHLQQGTSQGYLVLQCELPAGSYIHSLTQDGELNPSTIEIIPSENFTVSGQFHPDQPATIIEKDPIFQQRIEKHLGKIQFFVPFQVREGVDLAELKPALVFSGQVCSHEGVCIPIREQAVQATFAGYFERTAEQQRSSSQNSQLE